MKKGFFFLSNGFTFTDYGGFGTGKEQIFFDFLATP